MFFFVTWLVFFVVFWVMASFFRSRHKVMVSLLSSLVVSMIWQVLEQFYLSSILVVAFIFYFIIGNMSTFRQAHVKLSLSVLLSVSAVTGILSFTYFNQATVPSDADLFDRLWQSGYEADGAVLDEGLRGFKFVR